MADGSIRKGRSEYTIGWVCALPIERAAATVMLDERHARPADFDQPSTDSNSYTWGRIREHNIVIASLATGVYGTTSAATTAMSMVTSFPHIRFGLMVGIGGGVPSQRYDIRLGDVAVSQPGGGTYGGVIQYDLGQLGPGGKRKRSGHLNSPPEILLKALSNLQAEHEISDSEIPQILEDALLRNPKLAKSYPGYVHQGSDNDQLFETTHDHIGGDTCTDCDPTKIIQRAGRASTDPEIHYGNIASGNSLIKDATTRNELVAELEDTCICFEMEAAGLMNSFPCLVIRGISDYADSHKNYTWQRYAAVTAAAYAKELLKYISAGEVDRSLKALEVLGEIAENVAEIHSTVIQTHDKVEQDSKDRRFRSIFEWLKPPDPSTNLHAAASKRYSDTGSWFLDSKRFQEWQTGSRRCLALWGFPGSGKTILGSSIYESTNCNATDSIPVLYYFFDFNDRREQTVDGLLRSLVTQTYVHLSSSRNKLDALYSAHDRGARQPSSHTLSEMLFSMMASASNVYIIIDALDECITRKELFSWLSNMHTFDGPRLSLLFTSRKEQDIEAAIEPWLDEEDYVYLQSSLVNPDICAYVRGILLSDNDFQRWKSQPWVLKEIENELTERAKGMFRWVACQLDILERCLDLRQLRDALASLPKTLDDTYARILAGIEKQHKAYSIRILQILTYSERPLALDELVDAVVVDPYEKPSFEPELRMPRPLDLGRTCSSLISIFEVRPKDSERTAKDHRFEVQLAHFSVQAYLQSDRVMEDFKSSLNEFHARKTITSVCLAYILQVDAQEVDSNKDAFSIAYRFRGRPSEDEYPFLKYCASYWMQHAEHVISGGSLQNKVLDFLTNEKTAFDICLSLAKDGARDRTYPQIPLYYASCWGLINIARLLIENGANLDAESGLHGSALQGAVWFEHEEMVMLLLKAGADVDLPNRLMGSPLVSACQASCKNIVDILLKHGAAVNAVGRNGTALIAASKAGRKSVVNILLDHGADINALGGNALQGAVLYRHESIVRVLLDRGAEVNTPVQVAVWELQDAVCIDPKEVTKEKPDQRIIYAKATVESRYGEYSWKVNDKKSECGTPLQLACFIGNRGIAKMLLEHGSDVNVRPIGDLFQSPIQDALKVGDKELVQMLLTASSRADDEKGRERIVPTDKAETRAALPLAREISEQTQELDASTRSKKPSL